MVSNVSTISFPFISSCRRSSLPNLILARFLIHSKYDTVTPPAFKKASGKITVPFFLSMESASKVTGPFAASAMSGALILAALLEFITPSIAAGISISHSFSNIS